MTVYQYTWEKGFQYSLRSSGLKMKDNWDLWYAPTRVHHCLVCKTVTQTCRPDILIDVQQILYRITMMGLMVTFLWVPAHHVVKGDEGRQNRKGSYKETDLCWIWISVLVGQILRVKHGKKWKKGGKNNNCKIVARAVAAARDSPQFSSFLFILCISFHFSN